MCSKFLNGICEQNGNAKCPAANWPTESVGIATLLEYNENFRFLTVSCGPYMSHTLQLFIHILPEKGHKGWFLRKLFEVRIKVDNMLKD
jgi:hypothetical protein